MAFDFPEYTPPANAVRIAVGQDIQRIVDTSPAGTAFLLLKGTHRLQSISPKDGMSFYGVVENGELQTTLNGSTLVSNSQITQLPGGLYLISGQTQAGPLSPFLDGLPRTEEGWEKSVHPEDVFINDQRLKHVASVSQLRPGTFYFDYARDQIYLADDPIGKRVEVATTAAAFGGWNDNVTIRNLRVEKYANSAQAGAIDGHFNWLIEGNEVRLNHGSGIVGQNDATIRRNYVYNNGSKGIGAGGGTRVLIEENEVASNNANRFKYGFEASGIKVGGSDNIVRNNYVHDNDGRGIWVDANASNILIENNLVQSNSFLGIVYETSSRGIIRNNQVGSNGQNTISGGFSSQILIQNSRDTKVYGNRVEVAPNYGSGINIIWQQREPGEISVNNEVYSNQITYLGDSGQSGANSSLPQAIPEIWRQNKFFNNDYYFSTSSEDSRFIWGGQSQARVNFSEFRNIYGQEQGGSVSSTVRPLTWDWQFSTPGVDPEVPTGLRIQGEAIAQRTGFGIETLSDASGGEALSLKDVPASDGTATFQFNGVNGTYDIYLGTFDETDGQARFEIARNGFNVGSITLNQNLGSAAPDAQTKVRRLVATSVQFNQGDSIRIRGVQDVTEFARVDYVELVPSGSSQSSLRANTLASSQSTFDALTGTSSIDYLVGGVADNLFLGMMGNDVLISGSTADRDIFLFNAILEGQDIIEDFDRNDSSAVVGDDRDIIQISLTGFEATGEAENLQKGKLLDDRFVSGEASLGSRAGFRYFESSGKLYFDSNGGFFDFGTGSLILATLANKPSFESLSGSLVVI
jgi:parallel beta-helix repeat protein